jgi:hypothetical protein
MYKEAGKILLLPDDQIGKSMKLATDTRVRIFFANVDMELLKIVFKHLRLAMVTLRDRPR